MHTSCKRGLTLRRQQVILIPWAWTHASCETPRRPSGKHRTVPWTGTSAQSGKSWSPGTGRCLRRSAFVSGVSSGPQPEDVGRSTRQLCRSCVSPSSATHQRLHRSRTGHVNRDGCSISPLGGCSGKSGQRYAPTRPRAPSATQTGHRARQDNRQHTLHCTVIPCLVGRRCIQGTNQQQHGAPVSQHPRHAARERQGQGHRGHAPCWGR